MKILFLHLLLVCFSLLAASIAANSEGEDILRRQLHVGAAVASLFEHEGQTPRELEQNVNKEDESSPSFVKREQFGFRIRRNLRNDMMEVEE